MLVSVVLPIEKLTTVQIEAMYQIMEMYYENILQDTFISDLKMKRDVVLLLDEDGNIRGFTSMALFLHDGRTQLLYSGDTIVEKEYWGRHDLSQAWLINALSHAETFDGRTYWFLLTKGYKTYKYLHTFFNEFYPRVDVETPAELQHIMDSFAKEHYGGKYKNGVYAAGKDYLKGEYANIGKTALRNKNTAFFFNKNPGYMNGDELVCLCEISMNNLNKFGRRLLGR